MLDGECRGSRYSAADDALILEAKQLGFSMRETAVLLGRGSATALSMHLDKVQARAERPNAKLRERNCLGCRLAFMSEGPGNRMCATCRERSEHDDFESMW